MTFKVRIFINGNEHTPKDWYISTGLMPKIDDIIQIDGYRAKVEIVEWHYTNEHTDICIRCRGGKFSAP